MVQRMLRGLLLMSVLLASALACQFQGFNRGQESEIPAPLPTAQEGQPTPGPARAEDLARATVQVVALDREGEGWVPLWSGSGSVIDPSGIILTNQHVVDRSLYDFEAVGIAVTNSSDQPPSPAYLAEIVAQDPQLDLAVVRVVSDLDGAAVTVQLPHVEVGDSDAIETHFRIEASAVQLGVCPFKELGSSCHCFIHFLQHLLCRLSAIRLSGG